MKVAEQIEILERIARDEQTNATARVTAIRALRTVERDRESDELADELERLIADKDDGSGQGQPEAKQPLVQTPRPPAARAKPGDDPIRLPDLRRPASSRSLRTHSAGIGSGGPLGRTPRRQPTRHHPTRRLASVHPI